MTTNDPYVHPPDVPPGDKIVQHARAVGAALDQVAEWVRRHAADVDDFFLVDGLAVRLWPAHDEPEAYHRLVSALPEVVPADDLGSIRGPEGEGNWTDARVGPVSITIYTPASVCQRVQVGTKVIEVTDPDAPKKAVEVPVYEYRCTEIGGTA